MRRKYSWRGYDMKERESVTMPTKRESRPAFESASSCAVMPCFWSRNHQALPNWIFPGRLSVLKAADQGCELKFVRRVQVVQDHLRQGVLLREQVR